PRPLVALLYCIISLQIFFYKTLPPPPNPTLFPYSTLFRSSRHRIPCCRRPEGDYRLRLPPDHLRPVGTGARPGTPGADPTGRRRSEEHTSELQSRSHLASRIPHEKKKRNENSIKIL